MGSPRALNVSRTPTILSHQHVVEITLCMDIISQYYTLSNYSATGNLFQHPGLLPIRATSWCLPPVDVITCHVLLDVMASVFWVIILLIALAHRKLRL